VLAAMPFERGKAQLPAHKARRWWAEAVSAWFADAAETWFIRLSRLIAFYFLPAALIVMLIWTLLNG
jgi:hypothetical protein